MGKDTKKHLVGQLIFKQVIKILPIEQFDHDLLVPGQIDDTTNWDQSTNAAIFSA
jgi:hypothetical protein